MASPVSPERAWRPPLGRTLGYLLAGTGAAAFCLLLLQLLLGRRLAQQQLVQTGSEVAANVVLGEVALERFSPEVLGQISGMQLVVGQQPEPGARPRLRGTGGCAGRPCGCSRSSATAWRAVRRCGRPPRRGGGMGGDGLPLEPVWLFVSLPSPEAGRPIPCC